MSLPQCQMAPPLGVLQKAEASAVIPDKLKFPRASTVMSTLMSEVIKHAIEGMPLIPISSYVE